MASLQPAVRETDICGGAILMPEQDFVFVEEELWAIEGTPIAPHPPCPDIPIHCNSVMTSETDLVFIENIPICRQTDLGTCGHAAVSGQDLVYSE